MSGTTPASAGRGALRPGIRIEGEAVAAGPGWQTSRSAGQAVVPRLPAGRGCSGAVPDASAERPVSSAAAAGFALPWPGLARGPAGDEPGSVFRLELTAVPAAARVARDRARIVLAEWNVSPDDKGTAVLLISELVANAVKFGTAPRAAPAQVSLALAHGPGLLARRRPGARRGPAPGRG
jgi:hypothetical protein